MTFVVELGLWIVASIVLMSFVEHQVHQKLMHRRTFSLFYRAFHSHAGLHHSEYKHTFADIPVLRGEDHGIRLNLWEGALEALPVCLIIWCISSVGAYMFMSMMLIHHFILNQIHLEMHMPRKRFFTSWRVYKFLARHHFMHHKRQDRNFNVVFPFADYFFDTWAYPKPEDRSEMKRLGIL